jgi:hypothetical protein
MPLFDVRRYNDTIPGLKTDVDRHGDIRTTYEVDGDQVLDVNFSELARKVLAALGLEESPVEKYGVENKEAQQAAELVDVRARIKTIESNAANEMTKEASAQLGELKRREADLAQELA